jgi:nucleotide sugar dehydrogenase
MKIYGADKNAIKKAFTTGNLKVAVFGLGKMGLPLAAVFAECGAKVIGADINKTVVDGVNRGINHVQEEPGLSELVEKHAKTGRLKATTDLTVAAREADVHIILVPTFLDENNNPDLSIVKSVCNNIKEGLTPGDLVIQESTVPPKTTETIIKPILEASGLTIGDFGLAHCPERTMSGRAIEDITGAYPKVVGGVDSESTRAAEALYSVINKKGVIPVSNATVAEAVKVFEGIYRDVNIALANELAIICHELGISPIETFSVANTQPYSHIHNPSCGVGGHCIPVYPYFITKTVKSDTSLIQLSRRINDAMTEYTVKLTEKALQKHNRSLAGARILLLGMTYRGDVKETRCSPAINITAHLQKQGATVFAYDPLLKNEVSQFNAQPATPTDLKDIDAVIIAADHNEFKNLNWETLHLRHRIVIDGTQTLEPETLREKGFTVYSIAK